MDFKPKSVNNFLPGRAFYIVRCIKEGWEGFCQNASIGGVWSQAKQALHINILELRAAKFAILKFCGGYKKDLAVHV